MFISVKELERHKLTLHEEFPLGTIDFRTREFRQVAPLELDVSAELDGRDIYIVGRLVTQVELPCARCLKPVVQEARPSFDLHYRPIDTIGREEEIGLTPEEAEIGFYTGEGLFLGDVLAEQVHLALPMKLVCDPNCRGLCPRCGANLNRERCRCGPRAVDPRLAPLADWLGRSEAEGAAQKKRSG